MVPFRGPWFLGWALVEIYDPAPAGTFTPQVSGVAGATGEAMVEIYELP